MTKFSSPHKLYLTIVFAAIGIGTVCFFIVLPLLANLTKTSQELVTGREKLNGLIEGRSELSQLKKDYGAHQEAVAKALAVLVDSSHELEFIRFIEQTAKKTGHTGAYTLSTPTERLGASGTREALAFSLGLTGSFPSLFQLLYLIENGPYLINVEGITIERLGVSQTGETGIPVSRIRSTISFIAYAK